MKKPNPFAKKIEGSAADKKSDAMLAKKKTPKDLAMLKAARKKKGGAK